MNIQVASDPGRKEENTAYVQILLLLALLQFFFQYWGLFGYCKAIQDLLAANLKVKANGL